MSLTHVDTAIPPDWVRLYTDGGVVGRNPSQRGSCAWVGESQTEGIFYQAAQVYEGELTNNTVEVLAVAHALRWARSLIGIPGIQLNPDSAFALGEIFLGWRQTHVAEITKVAIVLAQAELALTRRAGIKVGYRLVKGHPLVRDITAGLVYPYALGNVRADALCTKALTHQTGVALEAIRTSLPPDQGHLGFLSRTLPAAARR